MKEHLQAITEQYFEKDLILTPVKGKSPFVTGWSKITDPMAQTPKASWDKATGVGLVCGEISGVICLDIDILDPNSPVLKKILEKLPPIFSGKVGNPIKQPSRFFQYNGEPTKHFENIKIDVLSDGSQTVMPPSIHPETGNPYAWVGKSLLEIDRDELPILPDGLIDFLESLENENRSFCDDQDDISESLEPGRCRHGSHMKISKLGVALVHKKYDFEMLVKRLMDKDRQYNKNADYRYFNCPSRKWKSKNELENAKYFVDELFKNHGPYGKYDEINKLKDSAVAEDQDNGSRDAYDTGGGDEGDIKYDKNGEIYKEIKFYNRYEIFRDNKPKIFDRPDYERMGESFFNKGSYVFSGSEDIYYNDDKKQWEDLDKEFLPSAIVEQNSGLIKTPSHINGFEKLIRAKCHSNKFEWKDATGLLNMQNGVIDIESGKMFPHDKLYKFRYTLPYSFDEKAKCPIFLKFIKEALVDDDLIARYQDFMGYTLLGGNPFLEKALFSIGGGENGKTVASETAQAVIGDNNFSAVSLKKIGDPTFVVQMDGKIANIIDESPTAKFMIESDAFKTIVSGGMIDANRKYKDTYKLKVTARMIINSNHAPNMGETGYAIVRRLCIIPFDQFVDPKKRDNTLKDRIKASELAGVLNWYLEGARRVIVNRKLTEASRSTSALESFKRETDVCYDWIVSNLFVDESILAAEKSTWNNFSVPIPDIYARFIFDMTQEGISERYLPSKKRLTSSILHTFRDVLAPRGIVESMVGRFLDRSTLSKPLKRYVPGVRYKVD
jgi:P4 family phage/plasmid primase-like protien